MSKYSIVHSVKVATDFTPETYGRLTTIGPKFRLPSGKQGGYAACQVCLCTCGNITVVYVSNLGRGHTESCGCLHSEKITQKFHRHGCSGKTDEYITWASMQGRCGNPNNQKYYRYGGRGIRVCDRWQEPNGQGFINFLADMGHRPSKKHSIDRIDNDGHYEPSNCKWNTNSNQARNRRTSHLLTFNGKTQCLAAWAE